MFNKKNVKNSERIQNLKKYQKRRKKINKQKFHHHSFPILGGRDWTRALQSSPFQISGGIA